MLDVGLRLAEPGTRPLVYVENEASAAAILAARIQDGAIPFAPLWSDLRTFTGDVLSPFVGRVDVLLGGIPCQPHSVAGQQRGADDPRDLWPVTARLIRELRPGAVFLENVPGILGYYFDTIWPDLRGMGYRVEAGLFSAAETGASHRRQRLYILAHSGGVRSVGDHERFNAVQNSGFGTVEEDEQQRSGRINRASQDSDDVAVAEGKGRTPTDRGGNEKTLSGLAYNSGDMANAAENRSQPMDAQEREPDAVWSSVYVPGPDDRDGWRRLLSSERSDDGFGFEPAIRREAYGLAKGVDGHQQSHLGDRLSAVGNGIVPVTAALAWRALMRAAAGGE
jgi:DNA (cytosine-5)-methyltransferase 1